MTNRFHGSSVTHEFLSIWISFEKAIWPHSMFSQWNCVNGIVWISPGPKFICWLKHLDVLNLIDSTKIGWEYEYEGSNPLIGPSSDKKYPGFWCIKQGYKLYFFFSRGIGGNLIPHFACEKIVIDGFPLLSWFCTRWHSTVLLHKHDGKPQCMINPTRYIFEVNSCEHPGEVGSQQDNKFLEKKSSTLSNAIDCLHLTCHRTNKRFASMKIQTLLPVSQSRFTWWGSECYGL